MNMDSFCYFRGWPIIQARNLIPSFWLRGLAAPTARRYRVAHGEHAVTDPGENLLAPGPNAEWRAAKTHGYRPHRKIGSLLRQMEFRKGVGRRRARQHFCTMAARVGKESGCFHPTRLAARPPSPAARGLGDFPTCVYFPGLGQQRAPENNTGENDGDTHATDFFLFSHIVQIY